MALTVGDLYDLLGELPRELPVILQKDAEGNGYSPADGVEPGRYEAETTWSGEAYGTESDPDEIPESAVPCVLLWPVN